MASPEAAAHIVKDAGCVNPAKDYNLSIFRQVFGDTSP